MNSSNVSILWLPALLVLNELPPGGIQLTTEGSVLARPRAWSALCPCVGDD